MCGFYCSRYCALPRRLTNPAGAAGLLLASCYAYYPGDTKDCKLVIVLATIGTHAPFVVLL